MELLFTFLGMSFCFLCFRCGWHYGKAEGIRWAVAEYRKIPPFTGTESEVAQQLYGAVGRNRTRRYTPHVTRHEDESVTLSWSEKEAA